MSWSWSGKYDGNGKAHGAGTETRYNGYTVVGTKHHGVWHGPMVRTWPSGEVWDAVWDNGREVSEVKIVSEQPTQTLNNTHTNYYCHHSHRQK